MREKIEIGKIASIKLADYRSKVIKFLAEKNITTTDGHYYIEAVNDAPYSIKVVFTKSALVTPEEFNEVLGTTGIVGNMSVVLDFEKLIKGSKEVEVVEEPRDELKYPTIHFLAKKKAASVAGEYPPLNP